MQRFPYLFVLTCTISRRRSSIQIVEWFFVFPDEFHHSLSDDLSKVDRSILRFYIIDVQDIILDVEIAFVS